MKKFNLPSIIFCVAVLSVAARAQIENAALKPPPEVPKINREFNPTLKTPRESDERAATTPAGATTTINRRRQQPYARPSKKERVSRYASDAFGVPALIGATFGATFGQIGNEPPEWRKTAGGFGKRFASSYATNAIRNTVSFGISEAFKLDNRFERSGQKSFGKRLKHVFVSSYTTRTKSGKRILDFPQFIGTYSASVIAYETWYPNRYDYKDGLRSGTISLGVRFGVNLLREFVFSK